MTYKQLFYNFLKYNNVLSLYKKNIYNRLCYYKEYGLITVHLKSKKKLRKNICFYERFLVFL